MQPQSRVSAFLDIGTNSVRLILVRILPDGAYRVLSQQKEVVRLGEGEFVDGYLQPEAMERAAVVCRKFVEMAHAYGADEIHAVATSATREAKNREPFLQRLRQDAGIDVRTISGLEEARLIFRGVASGLDLRAARGTFVDIGGGSTELAVGTAGEHEFLDSLKLGAIRLTSLFFMPGEDDPVTDERYALIQQYVRNAAVRTVQRFASLPTPDLAVGSSGTIENLADIAVRQFEGRRREEGDRLSLEQLREVRRRLCALPLEERRQVDGINSARADIIIAGAAILETLMEDLDLQPLIVSDRGLREGLIVDDVERKHPAALKGLGVRERSVLQLGRRCHFAEDHARQVARLALQLFDEARALGLHTLGAEERELLQHAAMLHDIGSFLSYSNHQRHSYYVIRNADLLGFDQTETDIVAAVARFHRKGYPKKKHRAYKRLDQGARKIVRPLAILLRLAEALDRSHAALIDRVELAAVEGDLVRLIIHSDDGCELERWQAHRQRRKFRKAFDHTLEIYHASERGTVVPTEATDGAGGEATGAPSQNGARPDGG